MRSFLSFIPVCVALIACGGGDLVASGEDQGAAVAAPTDQVCQFDTSGNRSTPATGRMAFALYADADDATVTATYDTVPVSVEGAETSAMTVTHRSMVFADANIDSVRALLIAKPALFTTLVGSADASYAQVDAALSCGSASEVLPAPASSSDPTAAGPGRDRVACAFDASPGSTNPLGDAVDVTVTADATGVVFVYEQIPAAIDSSATITVGGTTTLILPAELGLDQARQLMTQSTTLQSALMGQSGTLYPKADASLTCKNQ